MKVQQHLNEKTAIGRALGNETFAAQISSTLGGDILEYEVVETERGVTFERLHGDGTHSAVGVTHKQIRDAEKNVRFRAAFSKGAKLRGTFPKGTDVSTQHGPGWVHRVDDTSLGVTLKGGGVVSFDIEEVEAGHVVPA